MMKIIDHDFGNFILLKEYLESVNEGIEEFDQMYKETVQQLNEMRFSSEHNLFASEDIKIIQLNDWIKNHF